MYLNMPGQEYIPSYEELEPYATANAEELKIISNQSLQLE